jgi:hypothetical protein
MEQPDASAIVIPDGPTVSYTQLRAERSAEWRHAGRRPATVLVRRLNSIESGVADTVAVLAGA